MMRGVFLLVAALGAAGAFADPYVTQTLTLKKGTNHVYLEPTPTNSACADVFGPCSNVVNVLCYDARAFVETAQYDSDGNVINQKPVAYLVWHRDTTQASTLKNVLGGRIYAIETTNACSLALTGRPQLPRLYWYESTTNATDLANLVAPSLPETELSVKTKDYFGEGPSGELPTVYLRGVSTNQLLSAKDPLAPQAVYLMSAKRTADWSGVVGIAGADDGITFVSNGETQVTFLLQNCGTTNHTFRLTYEPGATKVEPPTILISDADGWTDFTAGCSRDFEIPAGEQVYVSLGVAPTKREAGSGILSISDLGVSKMRVRLPLVVEPVATDTSTLWPNGLYTGSFKLFAVADTNGTARVAGGTVEGTLLYLQRGTKGRLLQRLCLGTTTNGVPVYGLDLTKVRAAASADSSVRRISSVVLDPYQPVVLAELNEGTAVFSWTVGQRAATNPMRHTWHPDHDGLRSLSNGSVVTAPDGDDLSNYTESVKPETFSIANRVELTGLPLETNLTAAVEGTVSGTITWTLSGLRSKASGGDIVCSGTYTLSRVGAGTNFVDTVTLSD